MMLPGNGLRAGPALYAVSNGVYWGEQSGAIRVVTSGSPPETISLHEAVLMLTGTFCGGVAALALLTAAAAWLAHLWRAIALRVAGSWIAAIAILVLALRLAG